MILSNEFASRYNKWEKDVVDETDEMLNIAASHYENLFKETPVYRSHPYVDGPGVH